MALLAQSRLADVRNDGQLASSSACEDPSGTTLNQRVAGSIPALPLSSRFDRTGQLGSLACRVITWFSWADDPRLVSSRLAGGPDLRVCHHTLLRRGGADGENVADVWRWRLRAERRAVLPGPLVEVVESKKREDREAPTGWLDGGKRLSRSRRRPTRSTRSSPRHWFHTWCRSGQEAGCCRRRTSCCP